MEERKLTTLQLAPQPIFVGVRDLDMVYRLRVARFWSSEQGVL